MPSLLFSSRLSFMLIYLYITVDYIDYRLLPLITPTRFSRFSRLLNFDAPCKAAEKELFAPLQKHAASHEAKMRRLARIEGCSSLIKILNKYCYCFTGQTAHATYICDASRHSRLPPLLRRLSSQSKSHNIISKIACKHISLRVKNHSRDIYL